MAKIYEIDGIVPVIDPKSFVHPDAVIIGDVIIGAHCYIGPCASLRGDFGRIIVKDGSNIQDSCTVHSFPDKQAIVEEEGHVGHGAILHGCTVKKNALVGMNSVVMDDAIVGENSWIAANSFIKSGMEIPANTLVSGSPGRIIRTLTEQEIAWKSKGSQGYRQLAQRSLNSLRPVEPLKELTGKRINQKFQGFKTETLRKIKES